MRATQGASASRNHALTVLVVEDETDISDLVREVLQNAGYLVVHRANGVDGLSAAASLQPDIIILDLMLPDMGGTAVLRALKSSPQTCEIPVIISSAIVDWLPMNQRQIAFGILPKPFDIEELLRLVRGAADSGPMPASIGVRLRRILKRPTIRTTFPRRAHGLARTIIDHPRWGLKTV
ncbi:MAG TPA: response regulator [Chloroflexota bacterium]|nr:response regulator [Chloroflexota bacterium]